MSFVIFPYSFFYVCFSFFPSLSLVQFSPAPTMLEKQQEILSERLKSLKNKAAVVASLGTNIVPSSIHSTSTTGTGITTTTAISAPMLSLSSLKSVVIGNGDTNTNTNSSAIIIDSFMSSSNTHQQQQLSLSSSLKINSLSTSALERRSK